MKDLCRIRNHDAVGHWHHRKCAVKLSKCICWWVGPSCSVIITLIPTDTLTHCPRMLALDGFARECDYKWPGRQENKNTLLDIIYFLINHVSPSF